MFLIRFSFYVCSLMCLLNQPLLAFKHRDARSIGMGLTNAAVARGVNTFSANPANLAYSTDHKFYGLYASFDVEVGNNSIKYKDYIDYNGKTLNDYDINSLLNKVPDSGFRVHATSTFRLFSFIMNRIGFGFEYIGLTGAKFDKELLELALKGNEFNRNYAFKNMDQDALAFMKMNISYGREFHLPYVKDMAFGLSINLYDGLYQAQTTTARLDISTIGNMVSLDGDYQLRTARGGFGWGLDFGMAGKLKDRFFWSICFNNLFTKLSWDQDIEIKKGSILADSIRALNKNLKEYFDDREITLPGINYTTRIPQSIKLGVAYIYKKVTLGFDCYRPSSSWELFFNNIYLSSGLEYQLLSFLKTRLGFTNIKNHPDAFSAGFGIDMWKFFIDFGVLNYGKILPETSAGVHVAMDFGINF